MVLLFRVLGMSGMNVYKPRDVDRRDFLKTLTCSLEVSHIQSFVTNKFAKRADSSLDKDMVSVEVQP